MEEIDLDNIIGRRTRGRNIDFAKAAEDLPEEDEDEDEDDDFEAPGKIERAQESIVSNRCSRGGRGDERLNPWLKT
jgi:hypothetical protein